MLASLIKKTKSLVGINESVVDNRSGVCHNLKRPSIVCPAEMEPEDESALLKREQELKDNIYGMLKMLYNST